MSLEEVFITLHQEVYHFILKKVDNDEDAKDIMQTVFLKVSEKSDTLSEIRYIRGWVFTIAKNAVIDFYRKSKYKVYNNRLDDLNISREIEYFTNISTELDKCIHSLINHLPEKYGYAVRKADIEGIKQKDLAKEMGIPYSSVRSRVQRGRDKMKELMESKQFQVKYYEVNEGHSWGNWSALTNEVLEGLFGKNE